MSVNNIWGNIKPDAKGKYYYHDDKEFLETYNKYNKNNDYKIRLTHIPEPRLGNIDSKIFILSGNPSAKSKVTKSKKADKIQQKRLDSLNNQNSNHSCLTDNSDKWWRPKFEEWVKILIKAKNINEPEAFSLLSEHICSIEFFPYSSEKFGHSKLRLPSQKYQKAIVEKAINEDKIIIISRNEKDWFGHVPKLFNYCKLNKQYKLSSWRSIYFTNNNLIDYKSENKSEETVYNILSRAGLI